MCITAAVKSGPYIAEADTVKELAFLLDVDPIMNDGFIGDPIDNACLCNVEYTRQQIVGEANNEARQTEAAIEAVWDELQTMRGWQPIETAPKDGQCVIVFNVVTGPYCSKYDSKTPLEGERWPMNGWGNMEGDWYPVPTHWMPLPDPPEVKP